MYGPSQVSADPLAAAQECTEADLLGYLAYEIGAMESLGRVAYIYQLQVVDTEQRRGYGTQLVERVRVLHVRSLCRRGSKVSQWRTGVPVDAGDDSPWGCNRWFGHV